MSDPRSLSRGYTRKRWYKNYWLRIKCGLESCRNCNVIADDLTFDHLFPVSRGGKHRIGNFTILCKKCNNIKGTNLWAHLISLEEEEYRYGKPRFPTVAEIDLAMGLKRKRWGVSPGPTQEELSLIKIEMENAKVSNTPNPEASLKPTHRPIEIPVPPPAPGTAPNLAQWNELIELKKRVKELSASLEVAFGRIRDIEDNLVKSENATPRDELGENIIEFLNKYAGIKFNTGTIASNLEVQVGTIANKLRVLVGRGKHGIQFEKLEGHSAMYWIDAKTEGEN